jgi:CRP-like cAMP-binding protein
MDPSADSYRVSRTESAAHAAFEISNLRSLPDETRDRLVSAGNVFSVPAGATLHRDGDEAAHLEMVVSGLLRVFVTALDGRTLTVRYASRILDLETARASRRGSGQGACRSPEVVA